MSSYDWPIGFSGDMIRALLAGEKMQTRRLPTAIWTKAAYHLEIGDRVSFWARETWQAGATHDTMCIAYRADGSRICPDWNGKHEFPYEDYPGKVWDHGHWIPDVERHGPWNPWIHMPRWASRLTLELSAARYERLHDISEADAVAEGIAFLPDLAGVDPCRAYARLWGRLHDKPGKRWADNPEVAVFTFEPVRRNIDGGRV